MDIIPYFKELKEEGYTGKQKINRITRWLGVIFAFVQGYIFTVVYSGTKDPITILETTTVLTAGTCLLLWIGDRVTKNGIGNGLSLMIMAGILQSMPSIFVQAFKDLVTGGKFAGGLGIGLFSAFIIIYLVVIIGMVWIQLAERRIPIQYANRTNTAYGGHQNFLPIKINSAGVMPVIFASTLVAIPVTIVNLINNQKAINFVNSYIVNTSLTGFILYMVLILFFGYFYTFLELNPEELSKNLNKSGAYIPGIRPGNDTINYTSNVIGKLTIAGSVFLMIIAGLPIIFSTFSGLSSSVTIGGTGLLIVVGVAIETYKQLESSLISRSHRAGITRK
jgi:preprotein translocase subunit SecY